MGVPNNPDEAELIRTLDKYGLTGVKALRESGKWAYTNHPITLKWLTEREGELERLADASQSEQIDIARSAKDAAWAAATSARDSATEARESNIIARKAQKSAFTANIIATISAAVSIVAVLIALFAKHSS